jgi:hypothetical protein
MRYIFDFYNRNWIRSVLTHGVAFLPSFVGPSRLLRDTQDLRLRNDPRLVNAQPPPALSRHGRIRLRETLPLNPVTACPKAT